MGLPHPDAFNQVEPNINELTKDFAKPEMKAVLNPDGTLYSKNSFQLDGAGNLNKMVIKSTPDGKLFETPALEGSIVPRRTETE